MKYRTSRKWAWGCTILAFISIGPIFLTNYRSAWTSPVMLSVLVFMIYVVLNAWKGIYIQITPEKITKTDSFIFKKNLEISSIALAGIGSTFNLGAQIAEHNWSLYLFKAGEEDAAIKIPVQVFDKKDIAAILVELKKLNPSIKINSPAEALLKENL